MDSSETQIRIDIPDTLPKKVIRELEVEKILEDSSACSRSYVLHYDAKRGAE